MKYNYRKLVGRIVEICGTHSEFAKQLGISSRSLSLKINNERYFKQNEISKACDILGLTKDQISVYFFTYDVQTN